MYHVWSLVGATQIFKRTKDSLILSGKHIFLQTMEMFPDFPCPWLSLKSQNLPWFYLTVRTLRGHMPVIPIIRCTNWRLNKIRCCLLFTEGLLPNINDFLLKNSFYLTLRLYWKVFTQLYSIRKFLSPSQILFDTKPSVNNEQTVIQSHTSQLTIFPKTASCVRTDRLVYNATWNMKN